MDYCVGKEQCMVNTRVLGLPGHLMTILEYLVARAHNKRDKRVSNAPIPCVVVCGESHAWNANNCCTSPQTFSVMLVCRGSPHTSQISQWLLYPSLWLLISGLNSHFCHCSHCKLLSRSAMVSNIFEKATRVCKLGEPLVCYNVFRNG